MSSFFFFEFAAVKLTLSRLFGWKQGDECEFEEQEGSMHQLVDTPGTKRA